MILSLKKAGMKTQVKLSINILILTILSIFSNTVFATLSRDECVNANIKSHKFKMKLIETVKLMKIDYNQNTNLLLRQYEQLTKDLSEARGLSELSENTLKHCISSYMVKEVYDITNSDKVLLSKRPEDQGFHQNYIIPNNTWTEAANALEKDILIKRQEIKVALQASIQQEKDKQQKKRQQLAAEMKELEELKALVDENNRIEQNNINLANSIKRSKAESPKKTSSQSNNTSHKEGRSSFYVKKGNLFCLSESAFDHQISLLSDGIMEYASYCYETAYDVDVIMLDYGMLGKTKVKSVSQPTVMWVTTESVEHR